MTDVTTVSAPASHETATTRPGAGKVALVTGASSGIGEAAARTLAGAGFTVYAAARRTDRMAHLASEGIRVVALDVTDDASCQRAFAQVKAESGRLDVLVNNAGYGSYGAIEDVPLDEAQRQLDVNVIGLARVTRLALPLMRAQRSGRVINISSMGGKIHTSFGGWYHATKFAVEGLSDCLRVELRPFGVDVVVVEPGGIRTEWGGIAADNLEQASGGGAYGDRARRHAASMRRMYSGSQLSDPQVVADTILEAATVTRPRTRYAVGFMAKPLIAARRVLPDRGFDLLLRLARS